MSINEILLDIASDGSRLTKEAKLQSQANNELLKRVVKLTLDPFVNFYIKKIPEFTPLGGMTLEEGLDALELLTSRTVTGHAGIRHLQMILNGMNEDDADVIVKIIRGDLRCGASVSTVNKIWKDLIPEWPCLLCTPCDNKTKTHIVFPAYDQLKADGLRFNAIVVNNTCNFYSRKGSPIILLDDSLAQEFIKMANGGSYMFDGEMVAYGLDNSLLPRKTGNGIANKAIKGTITVEESKMIRGIVWDVVPYEDFVARKCDIVYEDRLSLLGLLLTAIHDTDTKSKIELIETKIVNSWDEAYAIFRGRLKQKLEGDIVKNMRGLWSDSRSKDQIKLKDEKSCELRVIGFNYGKVGTKNEHRLGSLECASEDGMVQVNISGFDDDQRNTITKENSLGRIVTVVYNDRISKKKSPIDSLFLPRVECFRDDKDVADTSDLIK